MQNTFQNRASNVAINHLKTNNYKMDQPWQAKQDRFPDKYQKTNVEHPHQLNPTV